MHTFDSLVYISSSEYPSRSANSVQVVKQSNAFAQLGLQVSILGRINYREYFNNDVSDLKRAYCVSSDVNLDLMKYPRISGVLRSALYPLWVAFNVSNKQANILYGRHALGLLSAGLISRAKTVIFECHGPLGRLESIALRLLVAMKKLDRIVAISNTLKNILILRYPYLQDVEIIVAHDGCEEPTLSQQISSDFSIGYVGSFYQGRGLDLIAKLSTMLPTVKFHLIGGEETQFSNITGMSLPKNIICHGRFSQAELYRYYDLFDVALAPYGKIIEVADGTNTVEYMSPLKIFEYMGRGKAIIASDLPALREILTDGVNAILAQPDDPKDWYKAILAMQDATIRTNLIANSIKDAIEKHTWKARAKLILNGVEK